MSVQGGGIPDLKKALRGDSKSYTLAIIDGNNMVFRAFLGYGNNSAILHPGVYGSFKFLIDILDTLPKKCTLCVAWDSGHDKKRKQLYPEYKKRVDADQKINKELLKNDLQTVQYLFEKLPMITAVNKDKPVEGDDIIYSVAKLWREDKAGKVLILSGDGDLLQLVDENTSVFNPMTKAFYSNENINKVLGYPKERFLLYKALLGDKSDNIPGVAGVGEETASKLVEEYASLQDIVSNPEMFAEKVKRVGRNVYKVCEEREIVVRNLKLMQLKEVDYALSGDEEPRIEDVSAYLCDMGYIIFSVPLRLGFVGRY